MLETVGSHVLLELFLVGLKRRRSGGGRENVACSDMSMIFNWRELIFTLDQLVSLGALLKSLSQAVRRLLTLQGELLCL